MGRADDILIPPGTPWLHDASAQEVCNAILAGGFRVYFVGGCVRNALLGIQASDIDLTTDAHPETVMALAKRAGLRAVPTGIDHGTVTLVSDGSPFEVTTFRRDVQTDGRRAVVAFSDNIADDARRRDFTMNALYATPDGEVIDPLGGLDDLLRRQVRFIEDATARIREDYLRALRYFRFCAWYGDPAAGFDPEALNAISANLLGLETLSPERVGQELAKLLTAPNPAPALAAMRQTGVLAIVLPGSDDRLLGVLVHMEQTLDQRPDWILRLAALGGQDVAHRLRLSRAAARQLTLLTDIGFSGPSLAETAYRHGTQIAFGALLLRSALAETMPDTAVSETIMRSSRAHFPVRAADLMSVYSGPALGQRMKMLEQCWIDSGFELSQAELLALP